MCRFPHRLSVDCPVQKGAKQKQSRVPDVLTVPNSPEAETEMGFLDNEKLKTLPGAIIFVAVLMIERFR